MALFNYAATDSSNIKRTGTVDARTKEVALSLLRDQGLFVTSISEKKQSILEDILNFRGVPKSEVVAFTRQFSTMISAGLPLSRALEVLAKQSGNSLQRKVLYDVLRSVEGGASLSSALGRYPDVFPPTYQALVRAGESSGKLDEILMRLADTMESERALNGKFTSAMIYPAIVMIAMVGVFFMLMVFVIPKLSEMYKNLNVPLPMVTQVMMATSDFMVKNVVLILVGAVVAVLLARYALRTEHGRSFTSEVMFRLPVFGRINKQKDLTQFTRTLSLLISSAVPIVEALAIVSEVAGNRAFRIAAQEASRQVEKGNELSEYFKSNPVFPPLVGQMTSVGEETGKVDEVLGRVATYYDGEVDHLVHGLSAALEPIILIILGTMVGFLIISIITPIYKITSAI